MFDNIAQLENEVAEFQKNIVASSQLVGTVAATCEAVRSQQQSLEKGASEIRAGMESQTAELKEAIQGTLDDLRATSKKSVEALGKKNKDALTDAIERISDVQEGVESANAALRDSITAATEKACSDFNAASTQMLEQTTKKLEEYLTQMGKLTDSCVEQSKKTSADLIQGQADLQAKYEDFLGILQETNISEMFSEVKKLKKSLDIKIALLGVGVGGTLVFSILSWLSQT